MSSVFFRLLIPLYQIMIITIPIGIALAPITAIDSWWLRGCYCFLVPLVYGLSYVLVCGLLSWPFRSGIREGKFGRSLNDPVFRIRRLHALCWTSIYYSPGYAYFLAFPRLRMLLFRLFGYRGALDFTCYPDTWIRDLPLLEIASGAYLSNKSTIGTNMVLKDDRILVQGVRISVRAIVGHLTMIGPGTCINSEAEISHGSVCAARVLLGKKALVKPVCGIDNYSEIGAGAEIGTRSYVGFGVIIGPDVKVPAGSVIPRRVRVQTQADMDQLRALEATELNLLRTKLAERLVSTDDSSEQI